MRKNTRGNAMEEGWVKIRGDKTGKKCYEKEYPTIAEALGRPAGHAVKKVGGPKQTTKTVYKRFEKQMFAASYQPRLSKGDDNDNANYYEELPTREQDRISLIAEEYEKKYNRRLGIFGPRKATYPKSENHDKASQRVDRQIRILERRNKKFG